MNTSNRKAIRLIHIPKTAGTTIASGLLRKFGRGKHYIIHSRGKEEKRIFESLDPQRRARFRVFIGHMPYETGIAEVENARSITFLRDPVSRVKSFIQHAAAGKSAYLNIDAGRQDFSIDEFLESGNLELSNLQTKFLVNSDRPDTEDDISRMGEDAAVELAIDRLINHVDAFGINERFDEGWVAVWTALGIKPPVYAQLNRRPDSERIRFSDRQSERIRDLNQLDLRVYRAAVEEFERRMQSGVIDRGEVEEFKNRQRTWGPVFTRVWQAGKWAYHLVRR